ncbi:hypothetical protein Tco_0461065 [Tanacetum coccineum]
MYTPGKKVPRKVLRYFSIIPRLQRLYKSRGDLLPKSMIWHATRKCTWEPEDCNTRVDGGAWRSFDMKYPDFAKEPRNVRLGLCADGFNPFGNLSQTYSMWPDIDVYLRPLIEDLQVLWDKKGVETTDIVSGQNFNMRAMVLWTINDFPARSSLSGWSGQVLRSDTLRAQLQRIVNVTQTISKDPEVSKPASIRFGLMDHQGTPMISYNACVVDGVMVMDANEQTWRGRWCEDPSRPPLHNSVGGCFIIRGLGMREARRRRSEHTTCTEINALRLEAEMLRWPIPGGVRLRANGSRLRAECSRLRAKGSDFNLMKRNEGRTLFTQKLLGILLLSRAKED